MNPGKAGYSLLEVLVAFAILTSVLAVVLPGKTALFQRFDQAETRFLAQDYAISRLERFVIEHRSDGGADLTFSETYRLWQITLSAKTGFTAPPSTDRDGKDTVEYLLYSVEVRDRSGSDPLASAQRLAARPQADPVP